jgi:DNA-binding transcriptional LysR family regulator
MDLDLRLLRYFLALANTLHFGHAADELGISQPVLSRQIRLLEAQLSAQLFERAGRSVALTEAGEILRREAPRTLTAAASAIALAKSAGDGNEGHLRVGFLPSAGIDIMPRVVRAYRRSRPNVTLRLDELFDDEQLAALTAGDLDIGFVRVANDARLEFAPVGGRSPLFAVVSGNHRLANAGELDLRDLESEQLLWWPGDVDSAWRAHYVSTLATEGIRLRVAQEVRSVTAILGMVAARVGITLLAGEYKVFERSDLRFIRVRGQDSQMYLAWRRERVTPLVRGFVDSAR